MSTLLLPFGAYRQGSLSDQQKIDQRQTVMAGLGYSSATAAKIPGVRFQAMEGIGHFPFAENPKLFAEYLLPILTELKG